ncbi:phosphoglycerate dehydrogenase [Chitinivibrio alkaliphilus]|uniref:D-3-phosphoglycerate dehydrogenase n=1 Tax=Chitinivibrio alkaliphilus ACht1 TaxID=1313304 RepID=U7D923_9BACT|nr:phosphoglycerate dehydrogenase [Chitinivibrio alkaliphilus]ERP38889.1 D-3-phosphoglycerate dehydrogenase [Chitinivibrio alkaliphilus ACht1]
MFKVQTFNKISSKGLDLLPRDTYEIASEISHPDAVILRSHKMHGMELPESVLAVARAGAGTNNVPVEEYGKKGVVVFNTPGANANSVKELVLTGMLLSSRRIVDSINWAKTLVGEGDEVPKLIEKNKSNFTGPEIQGKTIGIIGLGAIGVMVANAATALGMDVVGYDPYLSVDGALAMSRKVRRVDALETLIKSSDYITIHVPLNDHTKGMINEEKLSMVKPGVRILNFSRGGLVNNGDITKALENGSVAYYVTDFPDEDMIKTDKVIAIPHLGASTPEATDNCATMAATQLRDFLEQGNIKNSVNFPNVSQARIPGTQRITVTNRDVPNMVSQISTVLGESNLNIEGMVNSSRGDIAYNIVDVEGTVEQGLLEKLESIEGVVNVRLIP